MFSGIRSLFFMSVNEQDHWQQWNNNPHRIIKYFYLLTMEVSVEMTIPARGWHAYGKIVWQSPRKGEKLTTEKEKNKEALDIDLYAVAWMLKRKNKLIRLIVCHVPRKISWFICFFFMHGGIMEANVLSIRPLPSQIPSGGLKIMLKAKLTIDEKHA